MHNVPEYLYSAEGHKIIKVLDRLGEGGQGVVHLGLYHDRDLCVVKFQSVADAMMDNRAEGEGETMWGLPPDKGIANIWDRGKTKDGLHWMATEYIPGPNLGELVHSIGQPYPQGIVLHVMKSLCMTFERLREETVGLNTKNLLHRDLKLDNVIVSLEGEVKLVDWGLAKYWGKKEITLSGMYLGTLRYGAPELFRNRPNSLESEVFALGAICFALVEGKVFRHWVENDPDSQQEAAMNWDMRVGLTHGSLEVKAVINRALAYEASARYASPGKFYRALEEASDEAPSSQEFAQNYFKAKAPAAYKFHEEKARGVLEAPSLPIGDDEVIQGVASKTVPDGEFHAAMVHGARTKVDTELPDLPPELAKRVAEVVNGAKAAQHDPWGHEEESTEPEREIVVGTEEPTDKSLEVALFEEELEIVETKGLGTLGPEQPALPSNVVIRTVGSSDNEGSTEPEKGGVSSVAYDAAVKSDARNFKFLVIISSAFVVFVVLTLLTIGFLLKNPDIAATLFNISQQ